MASLRETTYTEGPRSSNRGAAPSIPENRAADPQSEEPDEIREAGTDSHMKMGVTVLVRILGPDRSLGPDALQRWDFDEDGEGGIPANLIKFTP